MVTGLARSQGADAEKWQLVWWKSDPCLGLREHSREFDGGVPYCNKKDYRKIRIPATKHLLLCVALDDDV